MGTVYFSGIKSSRYAISGANISLSQFSFRSIQPFWCDYVTKISSNFIIYYSSKMIQWLMSNFFNSNPKRKPRQRLATKLRRKRKWRPQTNSPMVLRENKNIRIIVKWDAYTLLKEASYHIKLTPSFEYYYIFFLVTFEK